MRAWPRTGRDEAFPENCTKSTTLGPETLLRRIRGAFSERESLMSKAKPTPMTREAADRIRSGETAKNGGKTPPGEFGTRADRAVQQRDAGTRSDVGHAKP